MDLRVIKKIKKITTKKINKIQNFCKTTKPKMQPRISPIAKA